MAEGVRRSAKDGVRMDAWTGTIADLGAVVRRVEGLVDEKKKAVLQEYDRETQDHMSRFEDDAPEYRIEAETKARAAERSRIESHFSSQATASEHRLQKLEGSPEEVLASIDRRVLDSFRLEAPSYGLYRSKDNRIVIEWDTTEGVTMTITGDDPDWVRKARAVLEPELAKGKPRWAWLRGEVGGYLASISTTIAALLLFRRGLTGQGVAAALLAGFYLAIFAGVLGTAAHRFVIRRRLPGFELLEPGQPSRGKEAVVFTAALLLQIPASALSTIFTK